MPPESGARHFLLVELRQRRERAEAERKHSVAGECVEAAQRVSEQRLGKSSPGDEWAPCAETEQQNRPRFRNSRGRERRGQRGAGDRCKIVSSDRVVCRRENVIFAAIGIKVRG